MTRSSYSVLKFSTVTEKTLSNSTIAFPFCLPLPFYPGSFSQLRYFTNSSHAFKGWGSREGPAKTILQLERESEMTFVYIFSWEDKNIFQASKQLEERTYQAFYNSLFLVSEFFLFLFNYSVCRKTCWILLGSMSNAADKNWLLCVHTTLLISILLQYACTMITSAWGTIEALLSEVGLSYLAGE